MSCGTNFVGHQIPYVFLFSHSKLLAISTYHIYAGGCKYGILCQKLQIFGPSKMRENAALTTMLVGFGYVSLSSQGRGKTVGYNHPLQIPLVGYTGYVVDMPSFPKTCLGDNYIS